ncbi:uncharacterized protein C8A04DRAFT_25013 [Dichotomopilus funicola]|uniref:Uncharacterized protein n=1 Tax=Dichotomopilus funicola TaxID=1934379 RepID=A0AAN6VAY0_9PEZI|nr:hypothetical protein C8A04DRAFT_25013 [Dichotomopilus funicola]
MAPSKDAKDAKEKKGGVASFKTRETQARLLAALVASLDGQRLDYKRIAEFFGSGVTESSMEHKFRPARAQAKLMTELVKVGEDPGEYDFVDMNSTEIQALFGESTAEGVAFQFRSIKKGAEVLKTAVEEGVSPVERFAAYYQPAGGPGPSTAATSSTKRARAPRKPSAAKRRRTAGPSLALPKVEDNDEAQEMADTIALSRRQVPLAPAPRPTLPPVGYPQAGYSQAPASPQPPGYPQAPAPAWPATSYSMAPIAGTGAAPPAPGLPNGYTDPATGYGYNVLPPLSRPTSSHSSSAIEMIGSFRDSRPGSSYSSSSYYASPAPASSAYGTPADTAANNTHRTSPYPQGGSFEGSTYGGSYTGPNTNPTGGQYSPTYHHHHHNSAGSGANPSPQYESYHHSYPTTTAAGQGGNSADFNGGRITPGPEVNPAAAAGDVASHYGYDDDVSRPYSAHSYEGHRSHEQQQQPQQDGWDAGDV